MYIFVNSSEFKPHSIAADAGCEIYDALQHELGYITISDEASFRYYEIPNYIS